MVGAEGGFIFKLFSIWAMSDCAMPRCFNSMILFTPSTCFCKVAIGGLLFGDDVSLPITILGEANVWPKTFDRTSWQEDPLGLRMKTFLPSL